MSDHLNCVDSEFVVAWWSPLRAIDNIRSDLSEQCELGFLHRFLHHVKFSAQLDEYVENLDQAWRAFDVSAVSVDCGLCQPADQTYCLIALQHRMNQQARLSAMQSMYDEKQNRLFRLLEFNLREDCGTWSIGPLATGPEWSCDWQGRTIIVRVLKAGAASKSGSVSSSSKRGRTTQSAGDDQRPEGEATHVAADADMKYERFWIIRPHLQHLMKCTLNCGITTGVRRKLVFPIRAERETGVLYLPWKIY
ncbi:hypothetical protein CERSUDRAFT_119711 [Gelatoporia subvermispora B]|uniref:Uncharacterized protein n=1 Tax=Ceriporiopsis subvermispora (strain B) TaxID=914234 RepID=M2QY96_CERS8|nr:hypothetical protein CERSUDRAFT_119711 [Gelatoporia subvermispora B]